MENTTQGAIVNQIPLPVDIQRSIDLGQNRVSMLEAEGDRLSRYNREIQIGNLSLGQENERLAAEFERLTLEITNLSASLVSLQEKHDSLGVVIGELTDTKSILSADVKNLEVSSSVHRADIESYRTKLSEMKAQVADAENKVTELNYKVAMSLEAVRTILQ